MVIKQLIYLNKVKTENFELSYRIACQALVDTVKEC